VPLAQSADGFDLGDAHAIRNEAEVPEPAPEPIGAAHQRAATSGLLRIAAALLVGRLVPAARDARGWGRDVHVSLGAEREGLAHRLHGDGMLAGLQVAGGKLHDELAVGRRAEPFADGHAQENSLRGCRGLAEHHAQRHDLPAAAVQAKQESRFREGRFDVQGELGCGWIAGGLGADHGYLRRGTECRIGRASRPAIARGKRD